MARQPPGQLAQQAGHGLAGREGDQRVVAAAGVVLHAQGPPGQQLCQLGQHFAGLDPLAADLDLPVAPPQVDDLAVAVVAAEVAAAVGRAAVQRAWHEALRGGFGQLVVAGSHAAAGNEQFARRAGQAQRAGVVHDEGLHVLDRPADRHVAARQPGVARSLEGHRDVGALGWAVDVGQLGAALWAAQPGPHQFQVQRLAAHRQHLQVAQ